MDNDRLIIHQDNDMTVEIDQSFIDFYEKYYVKFFRLNPYVHRFYMGFIAEVLMDRGMASPESIMVCSQRVYVLNSEEVIELEEPFDIFNDAFRMVSLAEDFPKDGKILAQDIMDYYNSEDFYCEIFNRNIFGVRGFFSKIMDGKVYVMFFAYEDEEEEK